MKATTRSLILLALCVVASLPCARSASAADAKDWGAPESFAVVNPVVRSPLAKTMSLSGEWSFTKDNPERYRLGVGEGVWGKFDYDWSTAQKIKVPGVWEAQGVGKPEHGRTWDCSWDCGIWDLNNVYAGRALYRRTFKAPKHWQGGRIWLKIGGVGSQAYLWINGKRAAFVETYCGARKYDVTDLVSFDGENEITALVRNDVPSRLGLLAVNEHFGGFFRDVELEATPNVYVDDVWARGDVATKSADVRVYVKTTTEDGKAWPLYDDELSPNDRDKLQALKDSGLTFAAGPERAIEGLGSIEVTIKDYNGDVVGSKECDGKLTNGENGLVAPFRFSIPIEKCMFWTPESPKLYFADVVIRDKSGKAIHGWTERFGVRELKVVGRQFFLNGNPYFLRGGGDHNYDQINLIEPANHDRFREHMSIYKEAGFNYMRFHTHSPLPEYFEVADEKGILLQPELPYYHDVTCEGFDFNPKRDMYELFRTNRRYVSFATYSYGNEGYLGSPVDKQMYEWVKKYDPDRLVLHQDGGTANKPGASDYTTNGVSGASIINPWVAGSHDDVDRPFVAHEYLNLSIKMDPRLEPRFTGVRTAPVSVDAWRKKLESVGLDEKWGAACIAASEKLQGIYQKRGLEAARIDSACDGYLFWSLVDASIPQGSCVAAQGYLNPFWEPRPNGIAPRDFYRFNGPTALLLSTDLPVPIVAAGDKFNAEFKLSHYDALPLGPFVELTWALVDKATGKAIVSGTCQPGELPAGFAGTIGKATIELPEDAVDKPVAAEFHLSLMTGHDRTHGRSYHNSWDYWLFPKQIKRSLKGFAVSNTWRDAFAKLYDDVKPIDVDAQDDDVWIVAPSDVEYYVGLSNGRRVFAISPASATPNVSLGWWSLGSQVGTTFADSSAFKLFPNTSDMTELWFRLVRAGAPDLASKPLGKAFEPLAVGEGRDSYYLYLGQAKFNSGKVLASYALDLTQGTPEATALLDSLLAYVASDEFDPKAETSSLKFTTYKVPEGVTWGYSAVNKTTEKDFMPWKTLYEESVPMLNCRQRAKGNLLSWKTAPVKLDPNSETTTFEFIGGLGYWSEPQTDGFELSFEGKKLVKFDLPAQDSKVGSTTEWNGENGAKLAFTIGRAEQPGPDFFGIFRLTVPNSMIQKDGQPALLSVESLGEKSLRWFAVSQYPGERVEEELEAK